MPLSEHERRQLEQIEQALRASDPRLAGAAHATDPRVHHRRRVIGAALGFLSGVGLLFAGLVINVIRSLTRFLKRVPVRVRWTSG